MYLFSLLWVMVITQRLLELGLAKRNEKRLKAEGAYEAGQEHYPLLMLLHVAFLISWLVESFLRGIQPVAWAWLPLLMFLAAQVLRVWVIVSLGKYWNTRILVLPGIKLIQHGPYRYLRHPNYVVVSIEILTLPLIFQAWWTALVFSLLNAFLLLFIRIPVEEKALSNSVHDSNSLK